MTILTISLRVPEHESIFFFIIKRVEALSTCFWASLSVVSLVSSEIGRLEETDDLYYYSLSFKSP